MKKMYDYLISRYGEENYQPNLYMLIEELTEKVKVLEDNYRELSNSHCQLQNSIEAVDNRIDILFGEPQ